MIEFDPLVSLNPKTISLDSFYDQPSSLELLREFCENISTELAMYAKILDLRTRQAIGHALEFGEAFLKRLTSNKTLDVVLAVMLMMLLIIIGLIAGKVLFWSAVILGSLRVGIGIAYHCAQGTIIVTQFLEIFQTHVQKRALEEQDQDQQAVKKVFDKVRKTIPNLKALPVEDGSHSVSFCTLNESIENAKKCLQALDKLSEKKIMFWLQEELKKNAEASDSSTDLELAEETKKEPPSIEFIQALAQPIRHKVKLGRAKVVKHLKRLQNIISAQWKVKSWEAFFSKYPSFESYKSILDLHTQCAQLQESKEAHKTFRDFLQKNLLSLPMSDAEQTSYETIKLFDGGEWLEKITNFLHEESALLTQESVPSDFHALLYGGQREEEDTWPSNDPYWTQDFKNFLESVHALRVSLSCSQKGWSESQSVIDKAQTHCSKKK